MGPWQPHGYKIYVLLTLIMSKNMWAIFPTYEYNLRFYLSLDTLLIKIGGICEEENCVTQTEHVNLASRNHLISKNFTEVDKMQRSDISYVIAPSA